MYDNKLCVCLGVGGGKLMWNPVVSISPQIVPNQRGFGVWGRGWILYNITAHLSPGALIRDVYRLYNNIHRRSYATAVGRHWKCLSPVWSNCLQARSRHNVAVAPKYLRDDNSNNNANIRPFIRNHYTARSVSNVVNIL